MAYIEFVQFTRTSKLWFIKQGLAATPYGELALDLLFMSYTHVSEVRNGDIILCSVKVY